MENVGNWILNHWGFCASVLAVLIQVTPAIKWNPLTALAKWVGKIIIQPAITRLDDMQKEVNSIKTEQDNMRNEQMQNEKDRIRYEVLSFANSCRNGTRHTRDEFQHVVDLNDKYEKLLKETNDVNGVFTEEYRYIVKLYHKCQERNDFLT